MTGSPRMLQRLHTVSRIAGALPNRLAAAARYRMDLEAEWEIFRRAERHNHKLDAAMLERCRHYSIETFGTDRHAPFLALCVSIHGSWRDGLIPEAYFFGVVGSHRYGAWYNMSRAKTLTPLLFRGPFMPDIAIVFNGQVYRPDLSLLPPVQVKDFLFAGRNRIIFKSDGGGRGIGIRFFGADDFDPAELPRLGNGVFQSIIEPHPEVTVPGVSALTTIRIGTHLDPAGAIRTSYVTLRLGRAGLSHVTSKDSVRLDIDLKSGAWADTGYLKDWTPMQVHPDAPYRFAGRSIPSIADGIDLCERLHAQVPFVPSIGWDLCLNRAGQYELMEWNVPHGISFAEPVNGPLFAGMGYEQLWKQDAAQ